MPHPKMSRPSSALRFGLAGLLLWAAPAPFAVADTVYSYDALGRLVSATYDNGSKITYTYDAPGNRTQVQITSTPGNHPPAAGADTLSLNEGSGAFTFNPRVNDTDADSDTLTVTAVSGAGAGTVAVSGGGTTITYTPTAGGPASDSFSYSVSDGHGGADTAVVSVSISNVAPAPAADSITVNLGGFKDFNPLANDTDAGGDFLQITASTNGAKGISLVMSPGTLRYVPSGSATGSDSFTYTVADQDGGSATATVNVTITNNHAPNAVADAVGAAINGSRTFDPRTNDTDSDGDSFTISAVGTASHGTAVNNSGASITYTPTAGYSGSDSFTYTIADPGGLSTSATVSVTVANNHAPSAAADTLTVATNAASTFNPRSNDTDADGDTLTISDKTDGLHGTVIINGGTTLTYTPATGYTGSDSFTYTVSDPYGATSTATVTATVGTNHAPVANADSMEATAPFGSAVIGTVGPLFNDTDADGNTLTITSFTNGTKGTVSQPSPGVLQYLANTTSANGTDTFTYTISDGAGGTATGTVTVTLTHENPE